METVCVIPARFESSRFPGKLIEKLDGREIILHVLDKVKKSKIPKIIVATDSDIIKIIVEKNGVEAVMTPPELPSGTDRIAFAVKKLGIETDYVLNVQGDEPFMEPELIDALVSAHYKNSSIDIFTAVKEAADKEIDDPNSVKVVISENNSALYFSRAAIPFYRDNLQLKKYWVHIGIYHYKLDSLFKFVEISPSKLEIIEKLEQLRALENGFNIGVIPYNYSGFGIDTEADLKKAENILKKV